MATTYNIYKNSGLYVSGLSAPPAYITGQTPSTSADWTVTRVVDAVESAESSSLNVTQTAPQSSVSMSPSVSPSGSPSDSPSVSPSSSPSGASSTLYEAVLFDMGDGFSQTASAATARSTSTAEWYSLYSAMETCKIGHGFTTNLWFCGRWCVNFTMGATIPQGATITSATFTGRVKDISGDTTQVILTKGADQDDVSVNVFNDMYFTDLLGNNQRYSNTESNAVVDGYLTYDLNADGIAYLQTIADVTPGSRVKCRFGILSKEDAYATATNATDAGFFMYSNTNQPTLDIYYT